MKAANNWGGLSAMKKQTKIILAAVLLAVVIIGTVIGVQKYQEYFERTFIVIDDVKYRRDTTSEDLSGKEISEFEKLTELTQLESIDLTGTGISIEQHDLLQAALPECQISWDVPFQGGFVNWAVTELDLADLTAEDLDVLTYFPQLTSLRAVECRNYPVIMDLMERYPDLEVTYTVEVQGKIYALTDDTMDINSPASIDELMEKLRYLPGITTVNLTGQLPANEELLKLQQAYPEITFVFDFEIFGLTVNTLDEFVDLSNIKMTSTEEIDAIMPHFYNLKQIDMVNCGLKNADMDALNKRYFDTDIVWTVNVCGVTLRTDARHFMPVQYHCGGASGTQCYNLRYCNKMEVVDLGHYGTNNVNFVEYMPNLKCLLICEAFVNDATGISNCTSLEYLELQCTQIYDLWPLTNLTNLRDLNLAQVPWSDITPLAQMTWLDRLWFPHNYLGREGREFLREALPNTMVIFHSTGHTTSGYRFTPRYYMQRDILGMYYGTN